MNKDRTFPLVIAVGCLTVIVLVCLWLLAAPNHETKKLYVTLEVAEQQYRRELADMDRRHAAEIQRLQEQINTLEFVHRKKVELMDDDVKRNRREIDDLRERLKARNQ